jgi:LPS-assembly lipoprotein
VGGLVVPVLLLLSACGFHLAGSRPLPEPLTLVYIEVVDPYRVVKPPLETALQARLLRRGAELSPSPGAAKSVLRLSDLAESREVLSVDQFGKAVEFQLTTRVRFELLSDGKVLVPSSPLTVSRDYSFNAQQVLAKEAEEARLQAFIQGELAELLMLRLEALLSRPVAAPAGAAGATPES